MKNSVVCKNCNSENPLYRNTCINCKSYLRDRVYNLDFWKIFAGLIENPSHAFRLIIFSEQKNYIFFILIFSSAKFLINSRFAAMFTLGEFHSASGLFVSYLLILASILILIFLYSLIFTSIGKIFSYDMRIKDNFAILSYSQILNAAALFILFPIELIIFGDYLFSINPTPFTINASLAYFLAGMELIIFGWSVFLIFTAFRTQLKEISVTSWNTLIYSILIIALITLSSILIFII